MNKIVPITLLTGYLGSGKTTLLNRILSNNQGFKIAVIVNDIGEINIDASLIQRGGIVNQKDESLVALSNGCICCTLKTDLIEQITSLTNTGRFDYIVIEASGICEPLPIAQTIAAMAGYARQYNQPAPCRLDCVATVVDALRMATEFACGDSLNKQQIDDDDIENLIIQQIEFCNIIILNKIDEVSAYDLNRVRAVIKKLQPSAEIIETNYADIDITKIVDSNLFDIEKVTMSAGWIIELEKDRRHEQHHHEHTHKHEHHHEQEHHHEHGEHCTCGHCHHNETTGEAEEYGIGTFVYYRRRGFSYTKFETFVNTKWPKNIIRSKGICYFNEDSDMSYMFDQAGTQKKLVKAGEWVCAAPIEEQNRILAQSEDLRKEWDEKYGDKMIKIVFIGQKLNREELQNLLDKL